MTPRRHWRSYTNDKLPSGAEALDEPLDAFPSIGVGTIAVGALVARAALRQARTATEVARIANRQAEIPAVRHDE